jgi:hypothetical protein
MEKYMPCYEFTSGTENSGPPKFMLFNHNPKCTHLPATDSTLWQSPFTVLIVLLMFGSIIIDKEDNKKGEEQSTHR